MSAKEFAGYGFAAGDIRGTRAWKVDPQGRLRGIMYERLWLPGENVAQCLRTASAAYQTALGLGAGVTTVFTRGGPPGGVVFGRHAAATNTQMVVCNCGCGRVVNNSTGVPVSEPDGSQPAPCDGLDPNCTCGFYAYQEGSNDYYNPHNDGGGNGPVGGVVRGYGKVVLGTRGFRAEKAEIVALYVDAEALEQSSTKIADTLIRLRVERNYGVPVFDEYLEMLREFPPDAPEHDDDFWSES